jgi:hypothetical protein
MFRQDSGKSRASYLSEFSFVLRQDNLPKEMIKCMKMPKKNQAARKGKEIINNTS